MLRLLAVSLALALVLAVEAQAAWTPPVSGPPSQLFDFGPDPFARGQHRGVDLAAAPGQPVSSACTGRVRFAGRVGSAGTVSVRCGAWRVTYAPLARIVVRAGADVDAGRRLGRLARMNGARSHHTGLHLGVRSEGRRFGYVDPLRFLSGPRGAPPPVVAARPSRPAPRARPAPRPARAAPGLAPWPVWIGLGLLMAGLAGVGTLRVPVKQTGGAACRASSTSSSSPTIPSSP